MNAALPAQIADIKAAIDQPVRIGACGSWPETYHRLDRPQALAIIAALSANRPILVRGEPGVGKSQLARIAAHLLQRRFLSFVVQPDSDYRELLWDLDHTLRLADAQLASVSKDAARLKQLKSYVSPGALWWALDHADAGDKTRCHTLYQPEQDAAMQPGNGAVLLVDEIDKADIALANGLLEVLGNGQFSVPPLGETVRAKGAPPLVVITSNDTRELPSALLRRCVVLDLALDENVEAHLVRIGRTHFKQAEETVLERAAAQIAGDRRACDDGAKTGLAEYLDLLRALHEISDQPAEQLQWLDQLGAYFQKSSLAKG